MKPMENIQRVCSGHKKLNSKRSTLIRGQLFVEKFDVLYTVVRHQQFYTQFGTDYFLTKTDSLLVLFTYRILHAKQNFLNPKVKLKKNLKVIP